MRSKPADVGPTSILVGIDGRPPGWEALRWATLEASAQGCPLRIMHVFNWPTFAWDACGYVVVNQWATDDHDAARILVEEGEDRAFQISTTLRVTTEVEAGSVANHFLQARQPGDLLVIGRRSPVGWLRPTPWSVSWQVARRSTTPVVLVRTPGRMSAIAPSTGKIVVVVDDLDGAFEAVIFALRTASRRRVGLTAILADTSLTDAAGTVQRWSRAFPDVATSLVRRPLVAGRLCLPLAEDLQGAALVVVGGYRRGRIHSALVASLDGEVVRETEGPIAFVRSHAHRSQSRPSPIRRMR